jgi:hypothetical protein
MPNQWQLETFEAQIGTSYDVEVGPSTTLELTLVKASPLSEVSRNPGSDRDPFSLMFHGPLEPILPQGIYRFIREESGGMDIFIVPIGPDKGEMRYEAVFT